MPGGSRILPEVGQVDSERVQIFSVSAVILDIFLAVSALRNRKPNTIESLRIPLGEIEQGVMGWVQLPASGKRALHRNGDPMPKRHALLFEMSGHVKAPLWQVVNENSAAWLHHTYALIHPAVAPLQVVASVEGVFLLAVPVILRKIEWGIGEDRINRAVLDRSKEIKAIGIVDRAESRAECWRQFHASNSERL